MPSGGLHSAASPETPGPCHTISLSRCSSMVAWFHFWLVLPLNAARPSFLSSKRGISTWPQGPLYSDT